MLFRHPFSFTAAIAISPLYCVTAFVPMEQPNPAFSPVPDLRVVAFVMLPASCAFAYALPRMRSRWFFRDAGFPYDAYVLPRWLLCLVSTSLLGASLGSSAAAVLGAANSFAMACLQMAAWVSFAYSASIRCAVPAGCEFAIPWRPRSLLRWK